MIYIKRLPAGQLFDVELLDINCKPQTPVPHRHEYFEIFWVLSGEGSQSIDFVKYPMTRRQMYLITPGQVHELHHLPDKLFAISFNAEFIDTQNQLPIDRLFLQNRSKQPYVWIDEQGEKELGDLISIIARELHSANADKELMSTLLVGFLRYVMRYLDDNESVPSAADMRMVKLLKLIDADFSLRKDTGYYSEKLSMTNKRLNELTRQQFSRTVTQLIHDKVIVEARRELAFTNKTIKTIAIELGYKDTSYFCRFFKRLSGQSPQSFRDTWIK
ncbi:AraC family transcriptional regulator [Candidatus Albibeggiatoa sp. nov. NOAA]|uniref:helix-turn-helix transcriptional regulator n=1 Tax=Candidatus Albibeggiatoa sp. nov. NOAA TaxID=3162724 RepID=UPI0032FE7C4F|nr:AraC family transcriptional regulator [Thiotrichaceae bacterium]